MRHLLSCWERGGGEGGCLADAFVDVLCFTGLRVCVGPSPPFSDGASRPASRSHRWVVPAFKKTFRREPMCPFHQAQPGKHSPLPLRCWALGPPTPTPRPPSLSATPWRFPEPHQTTAPPNPGGPGSRSSRADLTQLSSSLRSSPCFNRWGMFSSPPNTNP